MSLSGHQSARMKTADWLTPPEFIDLLGPFDLDPCCPPSMPWKTADYMWTASDDEDGLIKPWQGRVWLNPPFGHQAKAWIAKLAEHGHGTALLAARTETRMFFDYVWPKARAILFIRGRPHFHYPNGDRAPFNSGAPICLVAYGCEDARLLWEAEEELGFCLAIT